MALFVFTIRKTSYRGHSITNLQFFPTNPTQMGWTVNWARTWLDAVLAPRFLYTFTRSLQKFHLASDHEGTWPTGGHIPPRFITIYLKVKVSESSRTPTAPCRTEWRLGNTLGRSFTFPLFLVWYGTVWLESLEAEGEDNAESRLCGGQCLFSQIPYWPPPQG